MFFSACAKIAAGTKPPPFRCFNSTGAAQPDRAMDLANGGRAIMRRTREGAGLVGCGLILETRLGRDVGNLARAFDRFRR